MVSARGRSVDLPRVLVGQWPHSFASCCLGEADRVAGGDDDMGVVEQPWRWRSSWVSARRARLDAGLRTARWSVSRRLRPRRGRALRRSLSSPATVRCHQCRSASARMILRMARLVLSSTRCRLISAPRVSRENHWTWQPCPLDLRQYPHFDRCLNERTSRCRDRSRCVARRWRARPVCSTSTHPTSATAPPRSSTGTGHLFPGGYLIDRP